MNDLRHALDDARARIEWVLSHLGAFNEGCRALDADGYPTGSDGGPRSGDVTDPTYAAALSRVEGDQRGVSGRAHRRTALRAARLLVQHARLLEAAVRPVLDQVPPVEHGPRTAGNCQACGDWHSGVTSKLRRVLDAGADVWWCEGCYRAWLRRGPDVSVSAFVADRRERAQIKRRRRRPA